MWQNQIRMSRPTIILKLDRFVNTEQTFLCNKDTITGYLNYFDLKFQKKVDQS